MKRTNLMGLALPVILILGGLVTAAAQAVEAPYYGIESKRLAAGEVQEITSTQTGEYKLTAGATEVACKKSGLLAGATINGSNAGEPGTSKEIVLYKECTIKNNGTCSVGHEGNGEIRTESLKNELVYDATSKESKSVAIEYTPESGPVLSKITLSGAGCTPISAGVLAVEGQVVGQAFGGASGSEFLLELGKAPVLSTTGSVRFPATRISSIVLIKGGVGTQKTVSLSFAGKASKFTGESQIQLCNEQKYDIKS